MQIYDCGKYYSEAVKKVICKCNRRLTAYTLKILTSKTIKRRVVSLIKIFVEGKCVFLIDLIKILALL